MRPDLRDMNERFEKYQRSGAPARLKQIILGDPINRADSDHFMGNPRRTMRLRDRMPGEEHPMDGRLPRYGFILVKRVQPHEAPSDAPEINALLPSGLIWCERRVIRCSRLDFKDGLRHYWALRKIVGEAIWDKALRILWNLRDPWINHLDGILEALCPGCLREMGYNDAPYTSMAQVYEAYMPKPCRWLAEDCGQEYAEWDCRRQRAEILGIEFDEPRPAINPGR